MEPNRIGRALGIGARVAGAKLRAQAERLGTPAQPGEPGAGSAAASASSGSAASSASSGRAEEMGARIGAGVQQAARNFRAAQAGSAQATPERQRPAAGTQGVVRGAAQFGGALLRPFAHATNLLWHQIVGVFFALFAAFFAEHTWMVYRAAHWRDRHVFLYGGLAVAFGWFAVSTFWRVRRKQRR